MNCFKRLNGFRGEDRAAVFPERGSSRFGRRFEQRRPTSAGLGKIASGLTKGCAIVEGLTMGRGGHGTQSRIAHDYHTHFHGWNGLSQKRRLVEGRPEFFSWRDVPEGPGWKV